MSIAFYMDHHVPRAIALGLRLRGVEVITAYEDGTSEEEDPALLDRAGELGRVLFTRDDDLLAEATQRQRSGILFHGVIYAHQLRVSIGQCVKDLEIIAKAGEPEDVMNAIIFLPL
jgi:predicted nuclease of predicted toxin-antitoxin system